MSKVLCDLPPKNVWEWKEKKKRKDDRLWEECASVIPQWFHYKVNQAVHANQSNENSCLDVATPGCCVVSKNRPTRAEEDERFGATMHKWHKALLTSTLARRLELDREDVGQTLSPPTDFSRVFTAYYWSSSGKRSREVSKRSFRFRGLVRGCHEKTSAHAKNRLVFIPK